MTVICLNLFANQGHAPGLAGDPPTILLCCTVENPHPCAGVSSFPFGAELNRSFECDTKMIEASIRN